MSEPNRNKNEAREDRLKEELQSAGRALAGRMPFVGHVTWLCTQSASHRKLFVQDLEWRVFPPVMLDQCKLYFDNTAAKVPIAFTSWAYLSSEAERTYIDQQKIAPSDWSAGENVWLIDFIAPFGGVSKLLNELYHDIHKDREIKLLYPDVNHALAPTTLQELIHKRESKVTGSTPSTKH